MKDNAENIIELKHITKIFSDNGFTAVSDFNLEVKRGEFVTFLGPSGCGKTTTLRMIAGFDLPTEGQILLNGQDITQLPPHKRPINTVFQRYALFPHMNIYENIAFGLRQRKVEKSLITKKVRKVLELVDLEGFEKRSVATLSGGQQQRVAIARTLVLNPDLILFDEPMSALDAEIKLVLRRQLKEIQRKMKITMVYVTHDQEEAFALSDRIMVLNDLHIAQLDTPHNLYHHPADDFVRRFIAEHLDLKVRSIEESIQ